MRRLNERNKTYVYFANLESVEQTQDSDGLYTGENVPVYGQVQEARMVVGVATGSAALEQFGINDNYSVKAVTDDTSCTLSESSVVWLAIGSLRPYNPSTYVLGTPCIKDGKIQSLAVGATEWRLVNHTHIVTRVAKSFGYITYLLKAVDYDHYPTPTA